MASPGAIGQIREAALKKLVKEAKQIAAALDIKPMEELPTYRDRDLQHAYQIEHVANYLEIINNRIKEVAKTQKPKGQ